MYFFRSETPGSTQCLIMAHGGVRHPLPRFTVPTGCTLSFYASKTWSYKAEKGIRGVVQFDYPAMTQGGETLAAGSSAVDYNLSKVVGRHEFGRKTLTEDDTTYCAVRSLMVDAKKQLDRGPSAVPVWSPNVVTVRNRRIGASSIHLSEVIAQVKRFDKMTTTFYIAACRAEFIDGKRLMSIPRRGPTAA